MNLKKLKTKLMSEKYDKVRKVVVIVVGVVVIAAGVVLLFIPGPAFVVLPAGFAILAIEFPWARSLFQKLRNRIGWAKAKVKAAQAER